MATTQPEWLAPRHLLAKELVASIQQGLELRLVQFRNPSHWKLPTQLNPGVRLSPWYNLLDYPAVAKPSWKSMPVRFLRKIVRVLLRPWHEVQTRFNQNTIEFLEDQNRFIMERVEEEAKLLHHRIDEVRRLWFEMGARMQSLEEKIDSCIPSKAA
jgi:hypothetical protein